MRLIANMKLDAMARVSRSGVRWGPVGVFLLLAFGLSWACFVGLRLVGLPFTVRATAGMFGPAAAALLLRWGSGEGLRGLGLWPRWGWAYLWAYLLPILLFGAAVALALAARYQRWDLLGNWQSVLDATLREELGWRGDLLPRLAPLGGTVAAVAVGVIWGLWHAPVIALDGYEFGIRSWSVAPFFCLFTVPLAVILAWLRFRSGSVWPCVLMHAGVNAVAGLVLLALSRPSSALIG